MTLSRALRWRNALILLVVAGLALVVVRLGAGGEYGRLQTLDLAPLLLATGLITLAIGGLALGWSLILTRLDASVRLTACLRVFTYTWLVRYVPGTVPYHAARILTADALGTSKARVAASIGYEMVLMLSAGALIGCLGLLLGIGASAGSFVYLLAALPLIALPLVLRPEVLVPLANLVLRLVRRTPISNGALLTTRQTGAIFLIYAATHVINGLSFVFILNSLDGGAINPALAIGAYTLAGVAGTTVIFLPSGIGVREAVIVALMSSVMPPEEALLAAGAARAVSVIADLIPLAVLGLYQLTRRALHKTAPGTAVPSAPPRWQSEGPG